MQNRKAEKIHITFITIGRETIHQDNVEMSNDPFDKDKFCKTLRFILY